jgi:hypothetical protein
VSKDTLKRLVLWPSHTLFFVASFGSLRVDIIGVFLTFRVQKRSDFTTVITPYLFVSKQAVPTIGVNVRSLGLSVDNASFIISFAKNIP